MLIARFSTEHTDIAMLANNGNIEQHCSAGKELQWLNNDL